MKTLRILLILSLVCTTACVEENPKYSAKADARVQQLRKKIEEEVSTLKLDQWAGHYYFGDGLGVNVSLNITPKAGFVFEWHGCLGLYDRNYGKVHEKDNEIHLTFELENKREGFQGISPAFLPIKWGERRYLIATDEVVEFCNAINDGREPRKSVYGSFLLRDDDYKKKAEGFPPLPDKYRPYLLGQPIKAEIVKIGETSLRKSIADWNFRDTVVILNVGKKHGVRKGMEFRVHHPAHKFESATVKNVSEDSSEAVMIQIGEDDPLPSIGWKLSTASRWKDDKEVDDKPTQQSGTP